MGLWAGIVFRNNEFGTKGTIDVLLYQNYNFNGTGRDFSREICDQTEDIKYAVIGRGVGNGDALTKQCYVLSGFGRIYFSRTKNFTPIEICAIIAETNIFR